ncbi:MAG TPA: ABC transporter ATP-binding protein, partial [Firmicutes bacterium]|nr:ABC transporter ATP-binding protein [Bacillota bacterium]
MKSESAPSRSNGHLLEVLKVSKSFHGKQVVHEVSLELRQREIVGLLGRNGAGK